MARSLASSKSVRTAAAAAAYAAFWGALVAAAPTAPAAHAPPVAVSHRAAAAARWNVADRVYDEVGRRTRRLDAEQRSVVARAILEEAARAAIDPLLVLAVIHVESRFDVRAVSGAGAAGLMQLLHPTMHEEVARSGLASADPFDPVANVRAGVRYLDRMVGAFEDLELGLMAYNAGPARIRRHLREGEVPDRLLAYPRAVARELERLSATGAAPAAPAYAVARSAFRTRLDASHAPRPFELPDAVRPARPLVAAAEPDGVIAFLARFGPPAFARAWREPEAPGAGLPTRARSRSRPARGA